MSNTPLWLLPLIIVLVGGLPFTLLLVVDGVRGWRSRSLRRRAAGGRPLELATSRPQLRVVR